MVAPNFRSSIGYLQSKNPPTRRRPSSIAFSCLTSGLTMVYGRYNELVNGGYFMVYNFINQRSHHWAPSCRGKSLLISPTSGDSQLQAFPPKKQVPIWFVLHPTRYLYSYVIHIGIPMLYI